MSWSMLLGTTVCVFYFREVASLQFSSRCTQVPACFDVACLWGRGPHVVSNGVLADIYELIGMMIGLSVRF